MNSLVILFLLPAIFILFAKPRLATWLLIGLCVFDLAFAVRWLGAPKMLGRLPLMVAMLLFSRIISDYLLFHNLKMKNLGLLRNVGYLLLAFFCLFLVGNIYNAENLALGLYELRFYVLFFTLVYSIYLYIPIKVSFDSFVLPVVIVGLIQLPVTLAQNIAVNYFGVRLAASALDMASGTFGGYQPLVFCQTLAVGCLLTYQLYKQKAILWVNNYFVIVILVIPLLLSFSRSAVAFVMFTLTSVYLMFAFLEKNFVVFFKTLVIMLLFSTFVGVLFYVFFWQGNNFLGQLNLDYVYEYYFRDPVTAYRPGVEHPVMGRGRAAMESFGLISDNIITLLVGRGSGAVSSADFLGVTGAYFQEYGHYAGIGRTQFAKNICEWGILGSVFLIVFFLSILKFAKNNRYNESIYHLRILFVVYVSVLIPLYLYAKITTFNYVLLLLAYFLVYAQKSKNFSYDK